jgi:hypothetical protein
MAVFLSAGVFPQEVDLSALPSAIGPLRPAFLGTAKKGPLNEPVFLSSAQQFIDTFGEPFPESYLGYAVLAFFEEGDQCYVMRVGVEAEEGQEDALADIAIDMSGARGDGWGRIPIFSGIDHGRLDLRLPTEDKPFVFHAALVSDEQYSDAEVSDTDGGTTASISVTGTYTGAIDDSFVLTITGAPTISAAAPVDGATFELVRNSDGEVVLSGELTDDNGDGVSNIIAITDGLSFRVTVTDGVLDVNDTFAFSVRPDNRKFSISVEGESATEYTVPAGTYATTTAIVDAINNLVGSESYLAVEYTNADEDVIPQFRTDTAGERIQLMGTDAFALEVGTKQYAWDIPKSYLIGSEVGPYNVSSGNNRVKISVIGATETVSQEFTLPVGTQQTATALSNVIDLAGTVDGDTVWECIVLTIPGGTQHLVIVTTADNRLDTLKLEATYSNLKTLRFSELVGITSPYKRAYRGFSDNRLLLPDSGVTTAASPLSCEESPGSDDCASDTSYFANIVGWLTAPSPGTWVDDLRVSLDLYLEGLGSVAGRYKVTVRNASGIVLDVVQDVSFDKTADRYIGSVVNAGTKYGGASGNKFVNWEERPGFLDNDPNSTDYTVRQPSQFNGKTFSGQANGIPLDPAYSSELDSAVIGNPATNSGLYAFQNQESLDINLLATPGFSTGAVIGSALQICESRGDVLYLVDPPFGLRPQQVVDWHNGILLSDLSTSINSSYGALYWGWIKIYDQFSRTQIWVPPSGHISAIYSRTARVAEQWSAPAGARRGRILTALDIEFPNSNRGDRDLLYGSGNAVNPIAKFPQEGIMVYGQRTLQRIDSRLDRVHVRMLLSYVKKNVIRILRDFLFEPNDPILWKQVAAALNPFLADVQSRRGLYAYRVIVDSSNNTPERQNGNELWVSILLQPTPVAEFIATNIGVLQTGASFSAEEVLAAAGIVAAQTAT